MAKRWLLAVGAVAGLCVLYTVAYLAAPARVPTPPWITVRSYGCSGEVFYPPDGPFEEADPAKTGVVAEYRNGEEDDRFTILESLGGGVGAADLDNDGLVDLVVPQGGGFKAGEPFAVTGRPTKVFRNVGGGRFADWSDRLPTPAGGELYTHGVALGDYDRDGFADILVTGYGRVALFRNEADPAGGRRFRDVSAAAGLRPGGWPVSAAWADLDGDGHSDLYVCHYVNWSPTNDPKCTYDTKQRDVCPPRSFDGVPDRVYRNKGDGTFEDVSATAGILGMTPGSAAGKGLGVVACDFDGDGRPDVYVCNDTTDNHLYLNRSEKGKVRFEEVGLAAGVARDARGVANGSMGVAVADLDGGGRPSLVVTNYANENHALYLNTGEAGKAAFRDTTAASGLASIGQTYVGWGVAWFDWELRGTPDLAIAHGHAVRFPAGASQRAQTPVLLSGQAGTASLQRRGAEAGAFFQQSQQLRGLATADFLGDGRVGLAVSRLNGPLALVSAHRNRVNNGTILCAPLGLFGTAFGRKPSRVNWLGVRLAGRDNRDAAGAVVRLTQDNRTQTRFAVGGGSFASSPDPRHVFALSEGGGTPATVEVRWPHGAAQTWTLSGRGKYVTLREGKADAE